MVRNLHGRGNLSRYITLVPTSEMPHECAQCGQRLTQKGAARRHKTSTSVEKNYINAQNVDRDLHAKIF